MSDSLLACDALCVDKGNSRILTDVSFTLARGSITGLLGPSGSGKTTLMRTIVGVQRATSGRVTVLGIEAGSPELRRKIGYVTQSPAVYEDLTVGENIAYFGAVAGAPRARGAEALEIVGLSPLSRQIVRTLSGGERNRVSLATALLMSPPFLVLDEPTVGLDPVLRDSLWTTFRKLATDGTTLLVSSHVMDEAGMCDRLLLLRNGRLLFDAPPGTLLSETGEHDLSAAFLALVRKGEHSS